MTDDERSEDEILDSFRVRYEMFGHAIQSGVALELELLGADEAAATPKHLRVGVNSAMVEHAALIDLLIKKGIISTHEYCAKLNEGMEVEARRYERELSRRLGRSIHLL